MRQHLHPVRYERHRAKQDAASELGDHHHGRQSGDSPSPLLVGSVLSSEKRVIMFPEVERVRFLSINPDFAVFIDRRVPPLSRQARPPGSNMGMRAWQCQGCSQPTRSRIIQTNLATVQMRKVSHYW
jgi:hypothetical protein